VDERLEDLRARLNAIAEEIADLAHAQLRQALRAGARSRGGECDDGASPARHKTDAMAAERRLSRARRSVLKAASLLYETAGPAGEED